MQFRVLGPPGIHDDVKQRSVQLTSPKQRVLLGALLVRTGAPVPTDELIFELWGNNAPDKAGNALQAHVSRLRQQLIEAEPARASCPRLVARGQGYLLQARPEELDSVQFRLQVARAQRQLGSDPRTASVLLRRALDLWRGRALEGAAHGRLCAAPAARLEEERLLATEDLCEASLSLGQHRQAVDELQELVAAHPFRKRFRDQLVLALQRCGRHSEAQAVNDLARRRRTVEGGGGAPAGRPGNVRLLNDAAHGRAAGHPEAERPVTERTVGDGALGERAPGHELLRLRRRVEELTSQQDELRSEVHRLMALVEARALSRSRDSA
ncbi:BTAD domain-containing putative transcriptional regulator [Streptomyces sp. NPDC101166]|uniref:AfsR/SARP family transcriptional regulator n=1 Tax=Streptomyces sp. NPDC101166 TaxID=3366120 RepID=UPI00380B9460